MLSPLGVMTTMSPVPTPGGLATVHRVKEVHVAATTASEPNRTSVTDGGVKKLVPSIVITVPGDPWR